MIGALSGRRRAFVFSAIAVVIVAAAAAALALRPGRGGARTGGVPILVMPGYGGSAASVDKLAAALRRLGRPVVVVPGEDSGRGSIALSAQRLDRAVRGVSAEQVDLVGYSAGGVVVRFWAAQRTGGTQPRRIVTLGSPHHGTTLAAGLSGLSPADCVGACAELRPGSALLRTLADGDETPSDAAWTSIWTADDETVVPPESARLAGATNIRLQDLCPSARVSHAALVTAGLPIRIAVEVVATGRSPAASC